jgi:hypothetical protein
MEAQQAGDELLLQSTLERLAQAVADIQTTRADRAT